VEDVLAFEVARLGDAEVGEDLVGVGASAGRGGARGVLRQHGADLGRRPDVELALLALGVGVVGGVEAALGAAHLAQQPVERLLADPPIARVAEHLVAVQVGAGEQAVVVEHLLEVGDLPGRVDRIAGEAAAELVVDAAREHRVEGALDVLEAGAATHHQLQRGRRRELRRAAEAAVRPVGADQQRRHRLVQALRARHPARLELGQRLQSSHGGRRALADLVAFAAIGLEHRFHDHAEARHAAALVRREVGAAVEGHAFGVEEDGHRPAALPGEGLHGLHVDSVDVGTLLPVHLHADEIRIHVRRGVSVLEGLALHHVAPVTGRIADREQDRQVLDARPAERVGAPRIPVDGVLRVLQKVRTGLSGEPIGH
jgi:hypothetical protein